MTNRKSTADLLVTNGDLFTGDRAQPHFCPGAVAVKDGVILAVGSEAEVQAAFQSRSTIDAQGAIVHPGLIDTHLHLTSILFHGLPVDPDGRSRNKLRYTDIKCETDDDSATAFTAAAVVALLRRGFTLFMEAGTVFETDAFADTVTRCGMRGLVSAPFGWDDLSIFQEIEPGTLSDRLLARAPADAKRVIDQCKRELKRNEDKNALVQGFVCLYGETSASDDLTRAAVVLARDHGVIYSQHQAYLPQYVRAETKRFGESGISRLRRLGALSPQTVLSHLNILSAEDVEILQSENPGIVWCAATALHRGVHPAHRCWHPSLYKAGLDISLGMDTTLHYPLGSAGLASLLLSASVGERLEDSDPFYMQTIVAAKNIGLGDRIGSLSVGKRADIVVRSAGDITHTSLDGLGSIVSTSSSMTPVDTVIVDGRVVMKDGQLTAMDEKEVMASALHQRKRILERAVN